MANNKNNVQPKVVTTTTTTTSRRRGRRRRRTPRSSTSSKTTVRKVAVLGQPRRFPRRRNNRPGNPPQPSSSTFVQRITATLGTVGSNQGDKIELEMSALINPALIKETTGSNAYGPLQMYAANYSLWKLKFITVRLTPLVGGSAVSGTAIRVSLNMSGQPGSPNWSALGARKHRDTNPGRPLVFRIPGSAMMGPKEGWFLCNTKNDPQMCIGGSIEIHSYGKTKSTYQAKDYDGPLFLAELTGEWHFKNYNPEPGMLNLVKETITEQPQNVKIHSKPGEPILMSIPTDSQMARAIGQVDINADATPSEIIWQIADAAISAATGVFPPPFSWLFKSGWWFVKRIANKKQNGTNVQGEPDPGELTFQVFQSISDAQNDVPCISTGNTSTTNTTMNSLHLMQITPGNTGMQQETIAGLRRSYEPTGGPITIVSPSLLNQKPLFASLHTKVPLACVVAQSAGATKSKTYSYSIRDVNNPVFLQNGNVVDPTQMQISTYPILRKEGANYYPIGTTYAASHTAIGSNPTLHWTTCLWKATTTGNVKLQSDNDRSDQYIAVSTTIGRSPTTLPSFSETIKITDTISVSQNNYPIVEGNWYLSVFASLNGTLEFTNYGVPYYRGTAVLQQETSIEPTFEAYKLGVVMNTAQPLELEIPTTVVGLTAHEIQALRTMVASIGSGQQDLPFPLPPPPSEYDNLELPPLEGDEEEEQGAVGGYTTLEGANQQRARGPEAIGVMSSESARDIKNWVEFGHRKRPPTPFSPIDEEEEEEEESDLDDDDYAEVPSYIKSLLTPEAKKLFDDLMKMGLSHEKAVKAAQGAYPHPAAEIWEAAYHNALVDGLSPPSARDCAWGAVSDYLP
ncbi:MAG: ORF2 [Henan mamastrovirus 1]|nr:MAG: ORF2 [Henan mamastrovirus 1]